MGTANAVSTGTVQVTCTNGTFDIGWDNENQYFEGKGNIAKLYCQVIHNTEYVSDNLTDPQFRWYQGVVIQDTQTATVETQTPQVQETSTATESSTVVVDSPTSTSDSPTVSVLDTPAVTVETPTSLDTWTPFIDTTTVPV